MPNDYTSSLLSEFNTKITDLEEKQRLIKEKTILIGQNLLEIKEEFKKDITNLKISVEELKNEILKIKETIIMLSEELEKKANKNELELLAKQAKMFQPLEFIRVDDLKKFEDR